MVYFRSFWQIVIFLYAKSEAKIIQNLTLFSIQSKLSRLLVGHSTLQEEDAGLEPIRLLAWSCS